MPASVYPADLPAPSSYAYADPGLAVTSSLPGAHAAESRSSEPVTQVRLEFFCDPTQAESFLYWWRYGLNYGGCWFACDWQTPRGNSTVARFLSPPVFTHAGNGAFTISVESELRGDSLPVTALGFCSISGPEWRAASATTMASFGSDGDLIFKGYTGVVVSVTGNLVARTLNAGRSWTSGTTGVAGEWKRLDVTPTHYVAVAGNSSQSNLSMRSADGVTWSAGGNMPSTRYWYAMSHGSDGTLAAAGWDSNAGAVSLNSGLTWSARTMHTTAGWRDLVWTGSSWLAFAQGTQTVGRSNTLAATSWIASTSLPAGFSPTVPRARYAQGKIVVADLATPRSVVAVSTDNGSTWQLRNLPVSRGWSKPSFNGSIWVMTEVSTLGTATVFVWSADAVTWQQGVLPVGGLTNLGLVGSRFVAYRSTSGAAAYGDCWPD